MSFLADPSGRDGVGGVDPAVGVHDPARNAIDDAVDGVADVLAWRHQQRRRDVNDERRFVVEPKDIAVTERVHLYLAEHQCILNRLPSLLRGPNGHYAKIAAPRKRCIFVLHHKHLTSTKVHTTQLVLSFFDPYGSCFKLTALFECP